MKNLENLGITELNNNELTSIAGGNWWWTTGGSSGGGSDINVAQEVVDIVTEVATDVIDALENAYDTIFN